MPSQHPDHPNLRLFDHPLIRVKLARARDVHTPSAEFRQLLNAIAGLMTFEASRHFRTREIALDSPLETTTGHALAQPVTLVPILRAGIGLTDGILAMIPEARTGHIGVYRDEESLRPVSYYAKLPPDVGESHVLLVDPMLATGGSASYAVRYLRQLGCHDIRLLCLVAAPEGVRRMAADHADITVYAAALDRCLDEQGFIRPGLGDAGDRIFGTQ